MTIQRLHHVQITVPSDCVDEARDFYCGVLGLTEIPKPDSLLARGGFWVALGDLQVHIGVEDNFDRLQTKAHLAYQVDNVPAWRDKLIAHGFEIGESIPIKGYDRFEFRDPFGNRLELIQVV